MTVLPHKLDVNVPNHAVNQQKDAVLRPAAIVLLERNVIVKKLVVTRPRDAVPPDAVIAPLPPIVSVQRNAVPKLKEDVVLSRQIAKPIAIVNQLRTAKIASPHVAKPTAVRLQKLEP